MINGHPDIALCAKLAVRANVQFSARDYEQMESWKRMDEKVEKLLVGRKNKK